MTTECQLCSRSCYKFVGNWKQRLRSLRPDILMNKWVLWLDYKLFGCKNK